MYSGYNWMQAERNAREARAEEYRERQAWLDDPDELVTHGSFQNPNSGFIVSWDIDDDHRITFESGEDWEGRAFIQWAAECDIDLVERRAEEEADIARMQRRVRPFLVLTNRVTQELLMELGVPRDDIF